MKRAILGLMVMLSASTLFVTSSVAQPPLLPPLPGRVPNQNPPAEAPAVVHGCPKLDVKTVQQPVREGTPVKFTATVAGGDPKVAPMFDWSLTGGMITSGQGTTAIEVDSSGAGADKAITATLLIGGHPPECVMSASATAQIAGPAQKGDEFGTVSDEELAQRLDHFMQYVSQNDQAYVIAYGGKTAPRGTASANLKKIRAHVMKGGAVRGDRIVTMDGGFREQPAHELWLVPIGAEPPRATPTVDPKEVTPPKPIPAAKKKP